VVHLRVIPFSILLPLTPILPFASPALPSSPSLPPPLSSAITLQPPTLHPPKGPSAAALGRHKLLPVAGAFFPIPSFARRTRCALLRASLPRHFHPSVTRNYKSSRELATLGLARSPARVSHSAPGARELQRSASAAILRERSRCDFRHRDSYKAIREAT